MKKSKKILLISLIIFAAVAITGGILLFLRYRQVMSENGFTEETVSLCVDEELELPMKQELDGYAWSASNPEVVQVEEGKITAQEEGSSTITASRYWYKFSIEVKVSEHDVTTRTCEKAAVCRNCKREMKPALGHKFSEPTCTEDSKCTRCGIPGEKKALGHDCNEADCETASVCKTCSQEIEPALGHKFSEPTCTEDSKCKRCDIPGEEKALGHDMQEATCTEASKCTRCDYTEGKELGHITPKKTDCEKDTVCKRCGEVIVRRGAHQYAEATCTKPKTCKVCGKTEGKELGHTFTEATCTQKAKCTRCGTETGSMAAHLYVDVEGGRKICAYCGVEQPSYNTGGSGSGSGGSSGGGGSTSTDTAAWCSRVLEIMNEERANAGLGPLVMDPTLVNVATVRANEIIQSFSHTRPDGRDCFTAYAEQGASYSCAGENIAAGYSSPEAVMEGWMNSPGHRANILNGSFGRVGVGLVISDAGGYRYYWVQNFAD